MQADVCCCRGPAAQPAPSGLLCCPPSAARCPLPPSPGVFRPRCLGAAAARCARPSRVDDVGLRRRALANSLLRAAGPSWPRAGRGSLHRQETYLKHPPFCGAVKLGFASSDAAAGLPRAEDTTRVADKQRSGIVGPPVRSGAVAVVAKTLLRTSSSCCASPAPAAAFRTIPVLVFLLLLKQTAAKPASAAQTTAPAIAICNNSGDDD